MEEKLRKWNLEDYIEKFQDENVTTDMFQKLVEHPEALEEVIPKIGDRLIFQLNVSELQSEKKTEECPVEISVIERDEDILSTDSQSQVLFKYYEAFIHSVTYLLCICSTSTPVHVQSLNNFDAVYSDQDSLPIKDNLPIKRTKNIQTFLENFDLKELLTKSAIGRALLSWYDIKGGLDSTRQSYLVEIISTEILNQGYMHLSNYEYDIISKKIVQLFPLEITESYYLPPIKKRDSLDHKPGVAKGKLVDKFRNKLTFLRDAGILPSRSAKECNAPKEDAQMNADDEMVTS